MLFSQCMRGETTNSHCVEWLRLRSTVDQSPVLLEALSGFLGELLPAYGLVDAMTYVNAAYPGDTILLLRWQGAVDPAGSSLALRVRRLMMGHGLVDHSVWNSPRRFEPHTQVTRNEESP